MAVFVKGYTSKYFDDDIKSLNKNSNRITGKGYSKDDIEKIINLKNVHLFKKNKSLLEASDLTKLKKEIKEKVEAPNKDTKVYIISFSFGENRDKPFKFIITQYTLTPKLMLIPKDDDITQTFTYTHDELKKYKFKMEYIEKLIHFIKTGKKIFNKMNVSISEALDE
jgi:hypothetical protein